MLEYFTFEKLYAASGGLRTLPLGIPLGAMIWLGPSCPSVPALWAVSYFAVLQNCPQAPSAFGTTLQNQPALVANIM